MVRLTNGANESLASLYEEDDRVLFMGLTESFDLKVLDSLNPFPL